MVQQHTKKEVKTRSFQVVVTFILLSVFSACSPAPTPTLSSSALQNSSSDNPTQPPQATQSTPTIEDLLTIVIQDLSSRLGVPPAAIEVQSAEQTDWPNSSLGCPFPGYNYADVITPGYQITLVALGISYIYHTDSSSIFVLCSPDGLPLLPPISLTPGQIQDGIPWMPVDPVD